MAMQEIVFGPDNTLYSLEEDGVYVWNDDKTEKRRLVSNNHFSSLVVGENDKLYVLGTTKETILIIDPITNEVKVYAPKATDLSPQATDEDWEIVRDWLEYNILDNFLDCINTSWLAEELATRLCTNNRKLILEMAKQ